MKRNNRCRPGGSAPAAAAVILPFPAPQQEPLPPAAGFGCSGRAAGLARAAERG